MYTWGIFEFSWTSFSWTLFEKLEKLEKLEKQSCESRLFAPFTLTPP
jgi:hypothetical protein